MKRCPACNITFEEEWLSFCTNDGAPLMVDTGPTTPPPATSFDPGATLLDPQPPTSQSRPSPPPTQAYRPAQTSPPPPPPPSDWSNPHSWQTPHTSSAPPPPPPAPAWGTGGGSQPAYGGYNTPFAPSYSKQKSLPVASLILGVISMTVGFLCFGFITAPLAIVLGLIGLSQIKNQPTRYDGRGLAIAGITLGGIAFGLHLLLIFISFAFN